MNNKMKDCPLTAECSMYGEGKACIGAYTFVRKNVGWMGTARVGNSSITFPIHCASYSKIAEIEGKLEELC